MEILIATLLCAFISSVHAVESNSSLLETKAGDQTRHIASYVFTLWCQCERDARPQIFCGAAYFTQDQLITLDWCAQKIDEAIKEHNNSDYFQYSATVAPIENLGRPELLEMQEVYVRQDVTSNPYPRKFAVIRLKSKMELPGIGKIEWGHHENQFGIGFSTHGYHFQMEDARTVLNVRNINLEMQRFGWCRDDIGYQEYERCTIPANDNDNSYRPERGSPLFFNEKLVGINSQTILEGNPKCNCDIDIYLYILPGQQFPMFGYLS